MQEPFKQMNGEFFSAPQALLADLSALNNCIKYLWICTQVQEKKYNRKT